VLYVKHQTYDYSGKVVTKGLPNPFVDSLTHDSIIVQIPRLHGKINNRLDEVLSIFDQTQKDEQNQQMLNIDDSQYPEDDIEMQHIIRRLLMAATNAEMRMDMNVEDEYFSIIEKRDTEILQRDRRIAEQNVEIAAKAKELSQKAKELSQKDEQLSQKDEELSQKDEQLSQKDEQLRMSVRLLLESGLSIEDIASKLNIDKAQIEDM
jgi:uncharacterized protein (DUF3084 family)